MRRKVLARSVRSVVEKLEGRTLLSASYSANAGTAIISGFVYNDVNGNGVQDLGEPVIPGATVTLDKAGTIYTPATIPTVQTDINGEFAFSQLAPGQYFVVIVPETGFKQDNPQSFTVSVTANVSASVLIGETSNPLDGGTGTSTITGTLFNDVNQDGIYTPVIEDFLSGDTVYLDLDGSGVFKANDPFAITNNTGQYTINLVPPGDYLVRVVPRPGFHQDPPGYSQVLIYSDQTLIQDIGENNRATISGVVFQDLNGDGTQQPGDMTVGGETVFLDLNQDGIDEPGIYNPSTGLWDTDPITGGNEPFAMSNATGQYVFTGLVPGTYRVIVQSNAGVVMNNPGYIDITLALGQDLHLNVPEGIGSSFGGTVYDDRNANGVQDPNEPGLANQTVFLDTNTDGVNETVGPGTDGLPLRPIGVQETFFVPDPSLITSDGAISELDLLLTGQIAQIVLAPGSVNTIASITASTLNPNLPTPKFLGTGIAGTIVAVTSDILDPLMGTITIQAAEPSTVTDASGNFSFAGLGPGTYTARLITPPGGVPTGPANAVHGYTFTVGNGAALANQNFGFQTPDLTANIVNFSNKPTLTGVQKHAMVRLTNVGSLPVKGLAGINLWAQTTNGPIDTNSAFLIAVYKGRPIHLGVGQSRVFNVQYEYPTQLPLNTYYVTAQVVSTVNDNNLTNDFSAAVGPVKVGPPYVDYALTYNSPPALIVDPGQPTSASLLLTNNGNVMSSGSVTFRVYLSLGPVLEPDEAVFETVSFSNLRLRPGASKVVTLALNSPQTGIGFRYINVVVVSSDPLGETNLLNNTAIAPVVTRFD